MLAKAYAKACCSSFSVWDRLSPDDVFPADLERLSWQCGLSAPALCQYRPSPLSGTLWSWNWMHRESHSSLSITFLTTHSVRMFSWTSQLVCSDLPLALQYQGSQLWRLDRGQFTVRSNSLMYRLSLNNASLRRISLTFLSVTSWTPHCIERLCSICFAAPGCPSVSPSLELGPDNSLGPF